MGKKKRQNQSSNNIISHADSSESESSKDSAQATEASNKPSCPHINKSVDITAVRKNLKTNRDKNTHTICSLCKRNDSKPCKDGWVCLRCGSCNCGPDEENHRVDHFKTPRSDIHYLAYQINTHVIWCFKCEREIPVDGTKKIQGCADLIKKQYSDHSLYSPVKVETDTKKMNGSEAFSYLRQEVSSQSFQNVCLNKDNNKPMLSLPKVRGLVNLGNTCFFNSVVQCLAQTPGLLELLREMDVPGEKFHIELDGTTIDAVLEKHKTSALSEQLAQVLTEVSGVNTSGDGRTGLYTVNPKRLLDALTSKCPQFEGGDQHDAHELLRHLLDSVHTEDLRRYQKAILNHIGYSKSLDEVDEDKKKFGKKLNQKVCDTIPIRPDQIFKGSLVSELQCTVCEHVSKREEPFLDLSLPVAQEKAQPPVMRRKQNCSSPVDEEQNTEPGSTKCQQSEKRKIRRGRRNQNSPVEEEQNATDVSGKQQNSISRKARRHQKHQNGSHKEQNQGEPTIEEEYKKDSIDREQSDADVEDNACEEQDHKTEIVESGYSSEKQMSARGSPVTTQSPEEESKTQLLHSCDSNPGYNKRTSGVNNLTEDPETLLSKRAESGLGSIQELTVTIPEEVNTTECTSQDSVRVNASNGSPDVSPDSLSSSDYKLPPSSNNGMDPTTAVYNWDCNVADFKSHSQASSSVSLSVSPQCGSQSSQDMKVSPKCSPKGSPLSGCHSNDNMSVCTSLPLSNENMSISNSLPENVSMILNSPVKSENSQREDNSASDERPESRMECRKNRSSPVEPGEFRELDSGLLTLSLEGMTCAGDMDTDGTEEVAAESSCKPLDAVTSCNTESQSGVESVGGATAMKSPIPLPPPLPLFTSPYSFSHTEPSVSKYNSTFTKYKIEEGEWSLQSCLSQFTTIEMLAGANRVGCEACTDRLNKGNKEGKTVYQNSNKQLLISTLPPVMIFHLKRFQVQKITFRKISRHVDFPLVLNISPFCSPKKNEVILYSLYGVVEHSGTLHGGHYVAYVKVRSHADRSPGTPPPGRWYLISDSRVSDIDESSVLKTQAYLLFYERIL